MSIGEQPDTAVWDSTYPAYFQLGDVLASIARSVHHVDIDTLTELSWRQHMGLMREIDTRLDDSDDSPDYILDELRKFDRFRGRYPNITPEVIGADAADRRIDRSIRIFRLGGYITRAKSNHGYLCLRAREAEETAEIFFDIASDYVRSQPAFRNSFIPALKNLGIAACFVDAAHDSVNDYNEGKRTLPPNFEFNRLALLGATRRIVPLVGIVRHREVRAQLIRASHIRKERSRYKELA